MINKKTHLLTSSDIYDLFESPRYSDPQLGPEFNSMSFYTVWLQLKADEDNANRLRRNPQDPPPEMSPYQWWNTNTREDVARLRETFFCRVDARARLYQPWVDHVNNTLVTGLANFPVPKVKSIIDIPDSPLRVYTMRSNCANAFLGGIIEHTSKDQRIPYLEMLFDSSLLSIHNTYLWGNMSAVFAPLDAAQKKKALQLFVEHPKVVSGIHDSHNRVNFVTRIAARLASDLSTGLSAEERKRLRSEFRKISNHLKPQSRQAALASSLAARAFGRNAEIAI